MTSKLTLTGMMLLSAVAAGPANAQAGVPEPDPVVAAQAVDGLTAAEVLERTSDAYAALDTYRADGTVMTNVEVDGTTVQQASSFSMLLQKPDRYRITWEQMNLGVAGPAQSGAAWNDGTGPWFYMSAAGGFSKMASDEIALGAATGVSGGAANTVPTYFFSFWTAPMTPASRITDPQREADAEVDGEACYVVAGPSAVSKREVLFVSKADFLIRRYEYSYEPPAVGRPAVPEMTDEQLDEALAAMGQELTDESRERMREMVKTAMGAEAPEIKGGSVQIHRNVSTAKIDAAELKFSPPAGATETDSLFGGVFK